MFLKDTLILWAIWALVICHISCADDCDVDTKNEPDVNKIPLSLCQEFQAIRDLANRSTIQSIIQTHWNTDSRFRKAVTFMLSPQFNVTVQTIDNSPSYQQSLYEFRKEGINTTDIDGVSNIFKSLVIPLLPTARSAGAIVGGIGQQQRSLDTLTMEIINQIPLKEFTNFLKNQLVINQQFAKFYRIIRNTEFRARVTQAWKSPDIARTLKKLRRNRIDLINLVDYGLNLFSSGPEI